MYKKILLGVLTLVALVTLAACNGNGEAPSQDVPDMRDASPDFSQNADVCYQIFPISYADSTGDGDGDLLGIAENVEYLSETLNVDCVWLNPFNPSPSYHKYNVTDYYGIDETFGTMEDFETFMDVMDDHDIDVVMDFVINHTDFNHIWFQRSRMEEDDYGEWYNWLDADEHSEWHNTGGWHEHEGRYYYGSFWDQMPELNYDHPAVRDEIYRIAEYWIDKGIDGFRIDAARHIYDDNQYPREFDTHQANIDFFKEFNDAVKDVDENVYIVGEIWSYNEQYVSTYLEGMDSAFNFGFADSLKSAILNSEHHDVIDELIDTREVYDDVRDDYIDSVFLTNHDMDRVLNEFNEDTGRAKLAARILLSLPGTSWIYYGEELGMSGEKPDPDIRQPFIWGEDNPYNVEGSTVTGYHGDIAAWDAYNESLDGVDAQLENPDSILNAYIDMIDLKQTHTPLNSGELISVSNDTDEIMAYRRVSEDSEYLVLHNMSRVEATVNLDMDQTQEIYASHPMAPDGQTMTFEPLSTIIYEIESGSSVQITD